MENVKFEKRNWLNPAWQPTEEQLAQEKQIIPNEPITPEPPKPAQTNEEDKK